MSIEPVEVIARQSLEGELTPLSFAWQGKEYAVESTGRRWQDDAGQHTLVMIAGGQVFELLYTRLESRWYLSHIRQSGKYA
jgi:hypothetical protein